MEFLNSGENLFGLNFKRYYFGMQNKYEINCIYIAELESQSTIWSTRRNIWIRGPDIPNVDFKMANKFLSLSTACLSF